MPNTVRNTFVVAGISIAVLILPWIIGYGKAQKAILGAVPDYLARCVPNWNVVSWYKDQELFIPLDEFQRYLDEGCAGAERVHYPSEQYISNSVFVFLQNNLDRWYFMGYRTGEDHAIQDILPAWNRIFKNRDLNRKVFVSILALAIVGGCAFGVYVLRRLM